MLAEWTKDSAAVFSYEKYKFFDMAMTAANYDETALENFVSEDVQIIRQYDRENGTDYLRTLYVFLLSDKSYVRTALKLFTHKNTITYRINRLKELFNVDLSDMGQRISSFLLLRLLDYKDPFLTISKKITAHPRSLKLIEYLYKVSLLLIFCDNHGKIERMRWLSKCKA